MEGITFGGVPVVGSKRAIDEDDSESSKRAKIGIPHPVSYACSIPLEATPPIRELDWAGMFHGSPRELVRAELGQVEAFPTGRGDVNFDLEVILSYNGELYVKDDMSDTHMALSNVFGCERTEIPCPSSIRIRNRVGTNKIYNKMRELVQEGCQVRVMKCVPEEKQSKHERFKTKHGFYPFRLLFSLAYKPGEKKAPEETKEMVSSTRRTTKKVVVPTRQAAQPTTQPIESLLADVRRKMIPNVYKQWEKLAVEELRASLKKFMNV